ncbi:MAG: hypothetical protein SVX43_08015 [Cyanobacteriota bacterium]|nr:hypothetical protein [Cyanobacteriota bacterium]
MVFQIAEPSSSRLKALETVDLIFAGGVAQKNDGTMQGGGIYNYAPEQQKSLAEAAAEIQQLLSQLEQNYPTETLQQKAVVAEAAMQQIEENPAFKQKVIKVIKAVGTEALIELIDNPVVNVLRAGLEAWVESE